MLLSIRKLIASIFDIMASWYRNDRIRVSPTSGRLLQLQEGDSILLLNNFYRVNQRRLFHGGVATEIVYHLENDDVQAELQVKNQFVGCCGITARLLTKSSSVEVFEDDVAMLPSPV